MTTVADVPAAQGAEQIVNENFNAVSPAGLYGRRAPGMSGLTWGYYGGRAFGNTVADGTVALTASTTNYIVADRSTGAVSVATTTTNWNNTTDYLKLFSVVTGSATVTSYVDERQAIGASGGGGGGAVDSVNGQTGVVVLEAEDIDITDAGGYFTGADVEAALQELGAVADGLATVASTGAYSDLSGLPTLGTVAALSYPGGTTTYLRADGTFATPAGGGGGGSPGGSTTEVQYNSSGSFAGEAAFAYDDTNNTLSVDKINTAKGSDIARATTTDIGAAGGNFVHLTGTTTVTGLGTVAAGATRIVRFAGAGTLTHNATSLILPGGANITTAANDCGLFVSEGSGNWRCIAYSRASGQAIVSAAGASLTNFTGSLNTSSPNNTVNAARLLVTGGTTNVDFVLQPKVAGALLGWMSDATAVGGDKRGDYSTDWQRSRDNADEVASGPYSTIGGGYGNRATGQYATVPGGLSCRAPGLYSMATGYLSTSSGNFSAAFGNTTTASGVGALSWGQGTAASGDYSMAGGSYSTTRGVMGSVAQASGKNGTDGDTQYRDFHLYAVTSSTANVAAVAGGGGAAATNQVNIPQEGMVTFHAIVGAKRTTTSDTKGWVITGVAKNIAGTVSIVGSPTITVIAADAGASAWAVTVASDTPNESITFNCAGGSSQNILWTIALRTAEAKW